MQYDRRSPLSLVPGTSSGGKPTRLATVYERRLKFQAAWEWASSHPRIVIPIVIFLLGTISYLVGYFL